jgi:hypothetical protein
MDIQNHINFISNFLIHILKYNQLFDIYNENKRNKHMI